MILIAISPLEEGTGRALALLFSPRPRNLGAQKRELEKMRQSIVSYWFENLPIRRVCTTTYPYYKAMKYVVRIQVLTYIINIICTCTYN